MFLFDECKRVCNAFCCCWLLLLFALYQIAARFHASECVEICFGCRALVTWCVNNCDEWMNERTNGKKEANIYKQKRQRILFILHHSANKHSLTLPFIHHRMSVKMHTNRSPFLSSHFTCQKLNLMHHVVLPQFSIQFQWNATMHSRVTFLCSPSRTWCLLCWICYNFFLSFTLSLSYPFFPFHSHLTTVGFNSLPFNSLNILPLIQIRHATADTHTHTPMRLHK